MKKFKKFAVILALVQLLAAVGLFAACNNGEEQGGGDRYACEYRHKNRCSEHGKHVLET